MSKQTFDAVMGKWETHYAAEQVKETWGHLGPKKDKVYTGFILFCWASDGTICPIDYDFKKLPGSPWLYDAIVDFICGNAKKQSQVYRFDGTFCNYEFNGTITKIDCDKPGGKGNG